MTVALGHLKVIEDFALVPDVVAGGDHVDVQLEQLLRERGRDAETSRRVLPVGNDQVDGVIADNARQPVLDDSPSWPPENVANEENPHVTSTFDGNTRS